LLVVAVLAAPACAAVPATSARRGPASRDDHVVSAAAPTHFVGDRAQLTAGDSPAAPRILGDAAGVIGPVGERVPVAQGPWPVDRALR